MHCAVVFVLLSSTCPHSAVRSADAQALHISDTIIWVALPPLVQPALTAIELSPLPQNLYGDVHAPGWYCSSCRPKVQVSTYKYIEEASESLTADGGDLHGSLNVSEVLFGSSHGHIHFVNSHLLVPLEVTPRFPHSTQHAQHRARTAACK